MQKALLGLLFGGLVAAGLNLWLGWGLSQSESTPPETHLILGILSLLLSCGSCILLMVFSERHLAAHEKALLMIGQKPDTLSERNSLTRASRQSYAAFVLYPLSMITGTIAHPGKIPLLHSLIGLAVMIATLKAFVAWGIYLKGARK